MLPKIFSLSKFFYIIGLVNQHHFAIILAMMVYPRKMSVKLLLFFFFFQNVYGRTSIIIEPSSNLFTAKLFWSTFSRIWIEYGERARERVSLRSQSECGKMGARITPNMDTSYAVILVPACFLEHVLQVNKYSIFLEERFRFSILIKQVRCVTAELKLSVHSMCSQISHLDFLHILRNSSFFLALGSSVLIRISFKLSILYFPFGNQ